MIFIQFWYHLEYGKGALVFIDVHGRKRMHKGEEYSIVIAEFMFSNPLLSHSNGLSRILTMMIENNDTAVAFAQIEPITCKQK